MPASREAFVEQEFHAGRDLRSGNATAPSVTATDVNVFWWQAGPSMWFAKDADFDRRFRERFLDAHEAAARGDLDHWMTTPEGALALLVLLDQFPRNAFRGTPRMYATDPAARRIAAAAVDAGHDQAMPPELRKFFYLPFAPFRRSRRSGAVGGVVRTIGTAGLRPFRTPSRHRQTLRPLSPPQSNSGPKYDGGGAAISRFRRLRRIAKLL